METVNQQPFEGGIDYDSAPIAERQIDGIDYRVDGGRGSAVAISSREAGTWTWAPLTEGRWDGLQLKAKALGFAITSVLAQALAEASSGSSE